MIHTRMQDVDTAVIILNWNNADDTLRCLRSVLKAAAQKPVNIVIIDNGSEDDSLCRIRDYLNTRNISHQVFSRIAGQFRIVQEQDATAVTLLLNNENLGFAKAFNSGVAFLNPESFKWIMLLNNDTELHPDCLVNLIGMAVRVPQVDVWAPVITYYQHPELIWDVGGSLKFWGVRTFPGRKKRRKSFPGHGFKERTFLTGCALLIRSEIFVTYGYLTEDFFFGEEDFWLSKLLQKHRRKMAVCWEAEIRHKVAISIRKVSPDSIVPLVYIHNLNRLVNMKSWLSPGVYSIWKYFYLPYVTFFLWWKKWIPVRQLLRFVLYLARDSTTKRIVTREDFLGAKDLFL